MKKVKSGSDISFSFNVKVTDKTTVDEIIREASDIIKVRFAEYKVEPEESEDERMMKVIGLALTDVPEERFVSLGTTLKNCLAYLEKQKEKGHDGKKWIYEDDYHKDMERSFNDGKDEVLENPEKYGLQKEQKPALFNEPYNPDDYEVVTGGNTTSLKRKEQKPAEKQDYSGLNDLERAIHRGFLSAGVENVPVTIIKDTANECKRTQTIANENANAEWSEEDERILKGIIGKIDHDQTYGVSKVEMLSFLKSLRPVKQEWSKKDEDKLYQVMEILLADKTVALRDNPHCKALHKAYDEMIAWLKSIRPQPHWKPSEEQIEVLKDVAYGTYQNGDGPALRNLYDDLKKLGVKEEPEYYQHFDPDC